MKEEVEVGSVTAIYRRTTTNMTSLRPLRPLRETHTPSRIDSHLSAHDNQHEISARSACSVRDKRLSVGKPSVIPQALSRPWNDAGHTKTPPGNGIHRHRGDVVVTTPCWRHRPWQRRRPFGRLHRGSMPG